MILRSKILFHQVHPAKLATDASIAVISLYFFWQHQLTRLIGQSSPHGSTRRQASPPVSSSSTHRWSGRK
jgi:hypothetical protein